jgi:ketosteroid isomerase-like protein
MKINLTRAKKNGGLRLLSPSKARFLVALAALTLTAVAVRTEAQVTPHRCAASEYRQFDFWLGDWEVRDENGKVEGNNEVTLDYDQCVVTEHWSSPGQTGISLNMYDFRTRKWTQSWYDSFGNLLILTGVYESGGMNLEGARLTSDGKSAIERCRWSPLPDGRVHQLWESSYDGGKTWAKHFEGFYVRLGEKQVTTTETSEARVRELNQQYVDAFMQANVQWYREHLTDDFVCIESDGSRLNKTEFLESNKALPDLLDYHLEQVDVRLFGGTAIVHATGRFSRKDGSKGVSRYTDVYVKTKEDWKAVSAQVTRSQSPNR